MMMTLLAALAAPPPPLDAVAVPEAPVCSVTLTVDVAEAGDPLEQAVYRYDAATDAWSFLAFNGAPPDEKERREFEKRGRDGGDRSDDPIPPGGYYADSVAKLAVAGWTRAWAEANGTSLWTLETLPKGTVVANGRDLSRNIRLRYLIDEGPDGVRVVGAGGQLKTRWRIPLIARIDAFDIQRRFAPAPPETGAPGAMLPVAEHVEIAADVLGKDRSAVIDTVFGDWDCAAPDRLARRDAGAGPVSP